MKGSWMSHGLVNVLQWYGAVAGAIAALIVSLDLGRKPTGYGFVIFVTSSIALIVWGFLSRDGDGIGTQNVILFVDQPGRRLSLSDPQEETGARIMSVLTSSSTRIRTIYRAFAAHNRALGGGAARARRRGGAWRDRDASRAPRRARQIAAARPGRAAARSRLALPRDRPARRLRHVRRRGAGRRDDRRHRPRVGPRGDDRLQRRRR